MNYSQAVAYGKAYAKAHGVGGTVDIVSLGGYGVENQYEFTPSRGGSGGGGGSYNRGLNLQSLYSQFQKRETEAKAANVAREKEIRNIYANVLNEISGSNASLRASGLKDIETQSKQLVGQETQQMISSGLYGTTTAAGIPTKVASTFTQPARLKLEDFLSARKREVQLGLAGFVERIENPYPDYNALIQAQIAAAQ